MKKIFAILLTVFCVSFANTHTADASVPPGLAVRLLYSTANVVSSSHVILVTTTARAIQGLFFSNSSLDSLYVAVGSSHGAFETESNVALIPASGTGFLPLPISGDQRISVESAGRALTTGELDLSAVYY